MKRQIRLYDYIESVFEDFRSRRNNVNQIDFYDSPLTKKLGEYNPQDPFIKFLDSELFLSPVPLEFKKEFILTNIRQTITFQTIDSFIMELNGLITTERDVLDFAYSNDLLTGQRVHVNETKASGKARSNSIESTLPQDNVNMDLDRDSLEYADTNHITKNKDERQSNSKNTSHEMDPERLKKVRELRHDIMKTFNIRLFSQVYY